MYVCNSCDSEPSNGTDGYCDYCRDERELRQMIDAMSDSEYVAWKAARTIANDNRAINLTRDGLIRALTPAKHPEAAE